MQATENRSSHCTSIIKYSSAQTIDAQAVSPVNEHAESKSTSSYFFFNSSTLAPSWCRNITGPTPEELYVPTVSASQSTGAGSNTLEIESDKRLHENNQAAALALDAPVNFSEDDDAHDSERATKCFNSSGSPVYDIIVMARPKGRNIKKRDSKKQDPRRNDPEETTRKTRPPRTRAPKTRDSMT